MLDDMLALVNAVCLRCHALIGTYLALLICAGLIALCGAVLAVDARRQHARVYRKEPQNQKLEKEGSKDDNEKKKNTRQQELEEGVFQVGALRGQRGANRAR